MNELHDDNTTTFVRKQGIQSIKFKMWVELSSYFCHLSDIIRPPLRTNSLYEKPTVVFSPHTPCGRVRLARFTLEDHAYGASRLPKRPKTTVLQSRNNTIKAYKNCVTMHGNINSCYRVTTLTFLRRNLLACRQEVINSFRLFRVPKSALQIIKYFSQRHK